MDLQKLIDAKDSEIVTFKFYPSNDDEEMNSVRCLKSFLSSVSPIFTIMFNKHWNTNNEIMNDPVPFNQFDNFSNFIKCITQPKSIYSLTIYSVTCCYYYAEKYQMTNFKITLLKSLPKMKEPSTVHDLTMSLKFATEHNFINLITAFNSVNLGLNKNNGLKFFNIASEHNMEGLMNQVTNYMKRQKVETSWPINLITRIAIKNREDFNGLRSEYINLQRDTSFCCKYRIGYHKRGPNCPKHDYEKVEYYMLQ